MTRAAVLLLLLAALPACTARAPRDDAAADVPPTGGGLYASARGLVSVVGSEPATAVLLTAEGHAPVALVGEQATLLRAVAGLEVEVTGYPAGGAAVPAAPPGTDVVDVLRFTVVAHEGVAAVDGTIERDGGTFYLRLADGRRVATPALPPLLRDRVGARVYLAGPLDAPPRAWGIIRAER